MTADVAAQRFVDIMRRHEFDFDADDAAAMEELMTLYRQMMVEGWVTRTWP